MPSRFPKHAATVAYAEAELAKHVTEQPPGSNNGPRVNFYQQHGWLPVPKPGSNSLYYWCRVFTLTCIEEGGKFPWPDQSPGAWDGFARAEKRGWTLPPAQWKKATPGDECTWNIGEGHSSVLTGFRTAKGVVYVKSIDGNVSNAVERRERPLSELRGFVHWPEKPAVTPPVEKPPVFVVASSETGKVIYVSGARAVGRKLALILGRHPEGVVIRRKRVG